MSKTSTIRELSEAQLNDLNTVYEVLPQVIAQYAEHGVGALVLRDFTTSTVELIEGHPAMIAYRVGVWKVENLKHDTMIEIPRRNEADGWAYLSRDAVETMRRAEQAELE